MQIIASLHIVYDSFERKKKEKDKKIGFLFCKFYIWDKRNKHIVSYKARRSRVCGVKKISQSEALFAFTLCFQI